jgi:hypothetical protein
MVTSEDAKGFCFNYLDGSCIVAEVFFAILFLCIQLAGTGYCKRHKNQALKHILSFRMKYFDLVPVGQLVTRSVSGYRVYCSYFSQGLFMIISD